ncbi:MAG: peptidoglycan bridge formation glycyltransferase FemA/FemB family protein [Candidatus Moranbacteria bacterium]|nr:peptidoglycan bridge formation glycyltransferase FemA/FemB family protein [Candidatus Moranbacteria bacterium]MDD3964592.1 peptidoglycan bridge formation glycyltransferase FemA/FemB family protein [Candidatus Moranbacteria bacterium]
MHEFLQSKYWSIFQQSTGKEVLDGSTKDLLVCGIFHVLPWGGKYLYIPRGPIATNGQQLSKEGVQKLIEEAIKRKARWIRIEPENEESLQNIKNVFEGKIVRAPHDVQPRELLIMDITPDEEALLSNMKSKTRYNIRLAEKRGVKVFLTREEKYVHAFYNLVSATSDRKSINSHPKEYYEKFFEAFPPEICQLFVAEYNGEVLVANILILFEGRALYLHGGSSDAYRDVMAPFLLQWKQICFAKDQGCTEYDFGGIHTEDKGQGMRDKREEKMENKRSLINYHSSIITHPWEGITRFKKGFAPNTLPTVYPGTFDIILDSRVYFLYRTLRTFKNFIHLLLSK